MKKRRDKKEEKERKGWGGEKKKLKERGRWVGLKEIAWVLRRVGPHTNDARSTWIFSVFHHLQRTNNANNANHYVKLGKKRRESSKRNYYMISPRVTIKAIIIIVVGLSVRKNT